MWTAWAPFTSQKQRQQQQQQQQQGRMFAEFSLFAPSFAMNIGDLAFQPPEPDQHDGDDGELEIKKLDLRAVQLVQAEESLQQPQHQKPQHRQPQHQKPQHRQLHHQPQPQQPYQQLQHQQPQQQPQKQPQKQPQHRQPDQQPQPQQYQPQHHQHQQPLPLPQNHQPLPRNHQPLPQHHQPLQQQPRYQQQLYQLHPQHYRHQYPRHQQSLAQRQQAYLQSCQQPQHQGRQQPQQPQPLLQPHLHHPHQQQPYQPPPQQPRQHQHPQPHQRQRQTHLRYELPEEQQHKKPQRQAQFVRERYELPEEQNEPKLDEHKKLQRQTQLARERYELPATTCRYCHRDNSLLLPLSNLNRTGVVDQISSDLISFGELIGEGRFGEVFRGNYTGQAVAIKHFKLLSSQQPDEQEKVLKMFENEVRILKSLRHPNIVTYLGLVRFPYDNGAVNQYSDDADFYSDKDDCGRGRSEASKPSMLSYCIVTELCSSGTLFDFLRKMKPLSWVTYLRIAKDIVSGLLFLHRKNIIHRDLKPGNVLMSESGRAKIADFGLAHLKQSDTSRPYGRCGTRCFVAPEVLLDRPYGVEADVFSLGVVLCQMIAGSYPCDMTSSFSTSFTSVSGGHESDTSSDVSVCPVRRPPIPSHTLPDLRKLIQACWACNPDRRPGVTTIMEWLDSISRNLNLPERSAFDEMLEDLSSSSRQYMEQMQARINELNAELSSTKESLGQMNAQLEQSEKLRKVELVCAQSKYQRLQEMHENLQRAYRTNRTRPRTSLSLSMDGLMNRGNNNLSGIPSTVFFRRRYCLTQTSSFDDSSSFH